MRYSLAVQGKSLAFFGRIVESGAHQNSLKLILNREVDASAIDSTVLELEQVRDPLLATRLRIIDTFGPSPIPPWVASERVPGDLRQALREILLDMHSDPHGRRILAQVGMRRFAPVEDRDYDPIREMARVAFGAYD